VEYIHARTELTRKSNSGIRGGEIEVSTAASSAGGDRRMQLLVASLQGSECYISAVAGVDVEDE
jgi:hypothetical protein